MVHEEKPDIEHPAAVAAAAPATPAVLEQQLEYVPDGGKAARTVVLGSTLALFASAGMINAYVRRLLPYLYFARIPQLKPSQDAF